MEESIPLLSEIAIGLLLFGMEFFMDVKSSFSVICPEGSGLLALKFFQDAKSDEFFEGSYRIVRKLRICFLSIYLCFIYVCDVGNSFGSLLR